jgi:TonB family protein
MKPSIAALPLAVSAEDRLFASADPIWRRAKRRFGPLLIAVLLFHATLIAILMLGDQPNTDLLHDTEIPVEVVVEPPPPPPPPPQKKVEQQKPQPEKPKYKLEEKPAFDAPRTPNSETLKRQSTDNVTRAPMQAKPVPANETKPTPNEPPKPAQNAAPAPAEQTQAPEKPEDKPDAEPLDKAAPMKAAESKQRMKPAKERATLPDDQRAAVARQLASLMPSPDYSIAAEAKVAPVTGGTEDMRYLSVLYGLIMRQQHFPSTPRPRHTDAMVVVAFWIDETGALVHQALYRTSGYPELDEEAMADVRRAAPFPEPPQGEPHGFLAQMAFPAK